MKKVLSYKYPLFSSISFSAVDDLDLETLQDVQHFFVHGGIHGSGELCVHDDAGLGVFGLEDAGVGNDADVADQTHQLNFISLFRQHRSGGRIGNIHAEHQLVYGGS